MTGDRPARRRPSGLFLRVYLYGFVLLVISSVVSIVGYSLLVQPVRSVSSRFRSWLSTRVCAEAEPARVKEMLRGLPARYALYKADGTLVIASDNGAPAALKPAQLAALGGPPEDDPDGAYACDAPGAPVTRYVVVGPPLRPMGVARFSLLVGIVLATLGVGAIPLARSIARPLSRLSEAAKEIGAGNLAARTGLRRSDEIGDLARSLDEMAVRIEALLRAEKELLANVSHELRTPLSRLRVALEMVEESPELAKQYLPDLVQDLAELERLVEDVMTTARLDLASGSASAAKLPVRISTIAVADLAEGAVSRFHALHGARQVAVDVATDAPSIEGDPALLRRVLDNLLDNADKHGGGTEPVRLVARRDGDDAEIAVVDRGVGIVPGDVPHLFEPFFRTDRSRSRGTGGIGLGLTLAKRIVDAHGGTIAVESVVGKGTTVRVRLPAQRA